MQDQTSSTVVLDLTRGEAWTVLEILTQRSEQTPCPLKAEGSNIRGRPTINVILKSPGTKEALRREYSGGRTNCIREKGDHETEHFLFEWKAPGEPATASDSEHHPRGDSADGI